MKSSGLLFRLIEPNYRPSASWEHLPTEIWSHICRCMDQQTLQHFRLVNNKFAGIGGELLLESLHLHLDPSSLRHFYQVSHHPTISKGIRSIHFDCTSLNTNIRNVQDFISVEASELGVEDYQLDDDHLRHTFTLFHQKLVAQQAAVNLKDDLSPSHFTALGLVNVSHIDISSSSRMDMLKYQFPQAALDPLSSGQSVNSFITYISRSSVRPSSLRLCLPWVLVDSIDLRPLRQYQVQLTDVRINFGDSTHFTTPQARTLEMLKDFLGCMPGLEVLEILFTGDQCERERPEGIYDLEDLLTLSPSWPKMRSLALTGVRSRSCFLTDYLDARATVCDLSIIHLTLSSGSWAEVLTHIRGSLRLERVTIAGVLETDSTRHLIADGSRLQNSLQTWMMTPSDEFEPRVCPLLDANIAQDDVLESSSDSS